jgi:hypothetical protein
MLTTSGTTKQDDRWQSVVMITLAFWLSGSVIIDLIIMPGLAAAGMTTQPGFASAGYLLFEVFNHLELLCGALVLTGLLVLSSHQEIIKSKRSIILSGILLAISLIYTYILTPEMSGWGLQLSLFEPVTSISGTMIGMQYSYWLLELGKLVAGTLILLECQQQKSLSL